MSQTVQRGGNPMLKKRILVSQKRQITIPIEFYNDVGIEKEVECYIQNNAIVIRPYVRAAKPSGLFFISLILKGSF